jgi:hypothetical protein
MNNQSTIEQIRSIANGFAQSRSFDQVRRFQIRDLEFFNGISLRDVPLKDHALKGVLGLLKVRNNFVDFSNTMTVEDWRAVASRLTQAQGEISLYGKVSTDINGKEEIVNIYLDNPKKKAECTVGSDQYVDWITESLSLSTSNYSLKGFEYDRRNDMFDLTLLDEDTEVDVFKGGTDSWKLGERFYFNSLRFDYAPFFERLVCSNGNTAPQYGFGANISQAKFNDAKIRTLIDSSIQHNDATIVERLLHATKHLKDNEISLREFYEFRRLFDNDKYEDVANKYFDDQVFYRTYACNIAEKSNKWKSTARSGVNAYDFFNQLTWLASHPDQVKMEHQDRLNLQIKASGLLFRNSLDLEDVASPVQIEYPRLAIMD